MEQRKAEMDKLKIILRAAERKFEEIKEKINQVDLIAGPIKVETTQPPTIFKSIHLFHLTYIFKWHWVVFQRLPI